MNLSGGIGNLSRRTMGALMQESRLQSNQIGWRSFGPLPILFRKNFSSGKKSKLNSKRARLVLEDGTELPGYSFGNEQSSSGEMVFNTGMVGYTESLTDPSYSGQIIVMTYPLQGNYGVPADSLDIYNLRNCMESDKIHVKGMVVSEYSFEYSHWNASRSLSQWLDDHKIPGIFGIDTRKLTQKIRDEGSMLGKIVVDDNDIPFDDPYTENIVENVSTNKITTYGEGTGDIKILAVDVGMKHSIIRALVQKGAVVTAVPWDHDIVNDMDNYDGLFLSNGPGDPAECKTTIDNLRTIMEKGDTKPIFGICLGHQLLGLAAGASTFKMKYGHRGHNQPCVDLHNDRCYITSQNHGFCVDTTSLSSDWEPAFINANDNTSEGISHKSKPYFSVQFHPEAKGGPEDTDFLFDRFLDLVRENKEDRKSTDQSYGNIGRLLTTGHNLLECMDGDKVSSLSSIAPRAAKRVQERPPKKVLILGSGGLQIGQAGEFDYSGSQAIKALKEDGIYSILMNPNIATVQTAEGLANKVYFLPVTPSFVEAVILKEKPDGLLLQFGGQTALNCGVELYESGVLSRNNVQVLGTSVETIMATEDRDIFARKMTEIDQPIAKSAAAETLEEATFVADQIGYPVICRAAFSLGGLGSGFANNREELQTIVQKALAITPQVLVEKSMKGWKEVEYEVVRDLDDNCVTVCNMENFDPLGIHTGDSIVVAPSQTLDDFEYHMLRTAAIRIVRHLGVVGECNVQYALNPESREYCVIEVNPRLSRSSALASKATGYPLAFVACKLALGKSLPTLRNSVTEVTSACFEPSLDYIVTKIPRWDVRKFRNVSNELGSGMKSVGEVMGIGRTFEESFQKALRMVTPGCLGFELGKVFEDLDDALIIPTDQRVEAIAQAFNQNYSVDQIHDLTKIDKWFLHKLDWVETLKKKLSQTSLEDDGFVDLIKAAKQAGFCDLQISARAKDQMTESEVRAYRKEKKIVPVVKSIDTLGAEYPAKTNYLYVTYSGDKNDIEDQSQGVIILGGGCYCIGTSVEFDYTAVSAMRTLQAEGESTIVINYNPETVSTDYDESDRLYFEELSHERVLDISDFENPKGVIVSVGGQIPNNLSLPLYHSGVNILGTHPLKIDNAEDRMKFSTLCDSIGVDQPEWEELTTFDDAYAFSLKVGFPVLVRPSYVLSGAAMAVVRTDDQLEEFLQAAVEISREHPVVISKFIQGAKEIEMDGVGEKGEVILHAIHEHIEDAGVHSGDASLVLPPDDLPLSSKQKVYEAGAKIVKALNITGPFNAQFIVKGDTVKVIECNVRASRSFPFVSKILGVDFISQAAKVMIGKPADPVINDVDWNRLDFVGVKVANFSFTRLLGADPTLGVEMASTGEVACYGRNKYEAFLKAMISRNVDLPEKNILLATGEQKDKEAFLPACKKFVEMGYRLFATERSALFLEDNGVPVTHCFIDDGIQFTENISVDQINSDPDNDYKESPLPAVQMIKEKLFDLVINFPIPNLSEEEQKPKYLLRRTSVDFGVSLINNLQVAIFLADALYKTPSFSLIASEEYTHAAPSTVEKRKVEASM